MAKTIEKVTKCNITLVNVTSSLCFGSLLLARVTNALPVFGTRQEVGNDGFRPDLKKAALARISNVHKSLRVAKKAGASKDS